MNIKSRGFIQAILLTSYCFSIGLFFLKIPVLFAEKTFLGPVVFLILFCTSALICSIIVFAVPFQLFLKNKGNEALEVIVSTTVWTSIILVLLLCVLIAAF